MSAPLQSTRPLVGRSQPHDRAHRRRLADAVAAEQADAFAGGDIERDAEQHAAQPVGAVQILDREQRHGHQRVAEIDAAHFRVIAHFGRRAVGDQPPLVQDGDLLRDAEHHRHVVLGKQQCQGALAGDALQQPDRVVRLARRHAGGRLIQQQDLRVAGQGEPQFELLLVAVAEGAAKCVRLAPQPDRDQQPLDLVAVQRVGARPEISAAPEMYQKRRLDVLEDGQLREDVGALERAADAHPADLVRLHRR